tara:strand:- start:417 stop:1031 length:615 start_codon:yes stop_codon:yes gene_type:complete
MSEDKERGKQAEIDLYKLIKHKGWGITKATKDQNIDEHWDFLVDRNIPFTNPSRWDAKAAKKMRRKDIGHSALLLDWVWVELQNVQGKIGWLKGMADYFAFKLPLDEIVFKVVKAHPFRDWCKENIDLSKKTNEYKIVKNKNPRHKEQYNKEVTIVRKDIEEPYYRLKTRKWHPKYGDRYDIISLINLNDLEKDGIETWELKYD